MARGRPKGSTKSSPAGNPTRAAENRERAGNGSGVAAVGAKPSPAAPGGSGAAQPNPSAVDEAQRIALDLAEAERRRKSREHSRAWRERKRAAESIPTSEPTAQAIESPTIEEPGPPGFSAQTENVTGRRTYTRKPKVDLEAVGLIASNMRLMIEGIASYAAGQPITLTENENALIVQPGTRMLQALAPEQVKAVAMIADPLAITLGVLTLGSRVQSIRRDSDSRRKPPPAPRPMPTPPSGEQIRPDVQVGDDGHLVDIPAPFTQAYQSASDD